VVAVTDATDEVGEQFVDVAGGVELGFEPIGGGELRLRAVYDGDVLTRGDYAEVTRGTHRGRTNRGEFINNVKETATDIEGLDADEIGTSLRQTFEEFIEQAEEEELTYQAAYVRDIIDGTHEPVEIHGGEQTTWVVNLSYAGKTAELEFTAGEMVGSGAAALEEKLANYFYQLEDIEPEDWETIRDYWDDHSELVTVVDETGRDAVADRFVNKVADAIRPLAEVEQMPNDPSGAWYDADNAAAFDDAPADGPVLWVQSRFYADKLEAIGKQLEYKGQLTKDLIADGALYGSSVQRTWDGAFDRRTRLFPFDPRELGIDEDEVAPPAGDNTDEVEP
jgi:hypothetical protein